MDLIAHRGLINNFIKENTLTAFKNAIQNGYKGVEIDIRKTKDNEIVCIHDKMIDRTSNGKGNVNNMTYKELLKFNFGTKNNRDKIPLLKRVISELSNTIIFIELKEQIDLKMLENILDLNKTNEYYICSFNKKYIDNIVGTKYKRGIINYVFNSSIDLSKYDFVLILESLFNKTIYNYLTNKNIEPIIYNTFYNINVKNKEFINKLKYIV